VHLVCTSEFFIQTEPASEEDMETEEWRDVGSTPLLDEHNDVLNISGVFMRS
jgi:hypothetical protein